MTIALARERVLLMQRLFKPRSRSAAASATSATEMSQGHLPVLLEETIGLLARGGLGWGSARILDCTFGGGGHSRAILERYPMSEVTGIDTDPEAAPRAAELMQEFPGRVSFVDSNFGELAELDLNGSFDGILFDLGVSSFHFDTPGRGFSFRFDAPLDMRMNPRSGIGASDFLEGASYEDLVRAVRDYGEETRWRKVVQAIIDARGTGRLSRTESFAALIQDTVGTRFGSHIHPATKVFQGIRIAVNDEMQSIERALPEAFERLRTGGVLAVISFHSLEDRIVKRYFRREAGMPEGRNDSTPQQSRQKRAELLNTKPIQATQNETEINPRARSAKLRALRKL